MKCQMFSRPMHEMVKLEYDINQLLSRASVEFYYATTTITGKIIINNQDIPMIITTIFYEEE